MEYDFRKIEQDWQKKWKENKVYKVSNQSNKPKYYVLDMFPYPSGAGLHVGHPLGYIASDIYSRYKRLKGFNVLHPMGFDSFGLPAEQYALETGQHPALTTEKNIATFKSQLDKIGFCYDWDREVRTSDPGYYKWTQWLFLQLYNSYFCNTQKKARPISDLIKKYETSGTKNFTAEQWNAYSKKEQEDILMNRRLAFSAFGEVNWCEALGTVLANDEVVNGVSERGGHPVEKRKMRQWFLRITSYADRLLEGLETVDFSESMKEMQRNWIGKSEGAEIEFNLTPNPSPPGEGGRALKLKVYTTRPDTIFGVDFMVIAPEHELVAQITSAQQKAAVEDYLKYVKSRSERERLAEAKTITGCFTGAYAINPFDGREIPIWTAEYVLAGYGTGAIMAVPCGDQRDFTFAKHFNIPITNIIGSHYNGEEANPTKEAVLENSGFLNGLLMKDAIGIAVNKIEELGIGKRKVNYRMRDAGFSRQRYWGEPFPIVWKDEVPIALDEKELPLQLPHVDKYGPGPSGEGPLANLTDWVNLTPNPSPSERGTKDPATYGYINSTAEEWKKTLQFAKQNRKDATVEEDIIWQELRNRNIGGFKFRRQHPIAGYIPDFVCLEKKLIIEIDGGYHNEADQAAFDKAREQWLAEQGFTMIRFTNDAVNNSLNTVLKDIEQALLNKQTVAEEAGSSSPLPWRGAGGEVKRETSTMPGYAGSSWYFLRYMDPHNATTFCDRKASDYWNQVDLYIGGTEHAVGHLLYSRMWTKVMYDLGMIGFDEPYKKLLNQGMIQGSSRFVYRIELLHVVLNENKEIFISNGLLSKLDNSNRPVDILIELINKNFPHFFDEDSINNLGYLVSQIHVDVNFVDGLILNTEKFKEWKNGEYANAEFILEEDGKYICGVETEKMSKSKYNTVNPNDLCDKYGADTFRMYEMFLGPVEASKPWDTKGIEGVHRFLRKLWRLFNDELKGKVWNEDKATDAELKILHRTIKKIEEDTERFSFNTAVSTFMICVNELADAKCHKKEVLEKLLILLTPYAPHIAEELWSQLGNEGSVLDAAFPSFNPALLVESSKEYPVSVNGKLRTNINLALDLDQKQVEEAVLQNEVVQKWLEGKAPKKIIFVKNKMINVVI
ncbi:MAG TPA: class I tRNA ligase family protein [Ferruginibacter sp.]|nr:class I tRNA ligase family protein [Ferruginibacter sp.]